MVERYKRQDENHPNRKLTEQWKDQTRIKQKSILHIANQLNEKHKMPENIEKTMLTSHIPPNANMKVPNINTGLMDGTAKKNMNPSELKTITEKTIDQYPENWINVYTDGSAHKGTKNAGYGLIVKYPDKTFNEIYNSCGSSCSNYEAEAVAIEASLRHLTSVFSLDPRRTQNTVIFTDSKSVLQALESEKHTSTLFSLASEINTFLTTFPVKLVLQWIPAHIDIPGNEHADKLAKLGSTLAQPTTPVSYDTAKQIIKANKREEWMNGWAMGSTGRCVFPHMTTPRKNDSINTLGRHQQTIIFRLRTHHIQLNSHLNKITADTSTSCPLCQCPK